jgi:hypothetical protein
MRVQDKYSGPMPLASYVEKRLFNWSQRERSDAVSDAAESTAQAFGRLIEVLARKDIIALNEIAFIIDAPSLRIVE